MSSKPRAARVSCVSGCPRDEIIVNTVAKLLMSSGKKVSRAAGPRALQQIVDLCRDLDNTGRETGPWASLSTGYCFGLMIFIFLVLNNWVFGRSVWHAVRG